MVFPPTIAYQRADTMGGTTGYLLEMVRRRARRRARSRSPTTRSTAVVCTVVTTIQKPLQDAAVAQVDAFRAGTLPGQDGAVARPAHPHLPHVGRPQGRRDRRRCTAAPTSSRTSRTRVTYDNVQPGSTFKPFTLIAAPRAGRQPHDEVQRAHRRRTFGGTGRSTTSATASTATSTWSQATADSVNTVYAQLNLAGRAGDDRGGGRARGHPEHRSTPTGERARYRRRPADRHGRAPTPRSPRAGCGSTRTSSARSATTTARSRTSTRTRRSARSPPDVMADTTFAMTAGRREGVRQDVDQAARPTDRRQDRNLAGQQVGLVHRLHAQHRHRGVAEPDRTSDGTTAGVDLADRQDVKNDHRRHLAGVPVAVVHEGRLRAAAVRRGAAVPRRGPTSAASRRRPRRRPPRRSRRRRSPRRQAPTEIAVPSGLEGKLEGDATATVVNAGLVAERRLGVVRHGDVRPCHPGGPEGRHDARDRTGR